MPHPSREAPALHNAASARRIPPGRAEGPGASRVRVPPGTGGTTLAPPGILPPTGVVRRKERLYLSDRRKGLECGSFPAPEPFPETPGTLIPFEIGKRP